jgi:pimeloyl-ACP methyl ester carboxylesterase
MLLLCCQLGWIAGGKMSRPLLLIHGYSADGLDFAPLSTALQGKGIQAVDLNIGNYVSLNNEITIKDIAEGLDRAFRLHSSLNSAPEFDAIVHSTGMLVARSWLTNYGAAVGSNDRLKKLKHLVGVAPATWGSPQAHKGRTWLGALVKGSKTPGPDFLNAGDEVLDGLELGSRFTWDLALTDLVGPVPYYGKGADTPYVSVFIGNQPYEGLSSVANDPGTDGTVRWAGCGLNTRKITVDLTRTPIGDDGKPASRTSITPWAMDRLDIPVIAVKGRDHGTLISNPDDGMVQLIVDFLSVADADAHDKWLAAAKAYGEPAKQKMLIDPGKDASGIIGAAKTYFGHLFNLSGHDIEGWQQFVVRARDERGDPVTDYLFEVLRKDGDNWVQFEEMYTDVHAYAADPSYRCFHMRLPQGICGGNIPLHLRIHASTGTELMAYQGYGTDDVETKMGPQAGPVEIDLSGFGSNNDSLFHPFTTTMVEIVLNREPSPLNAVSQIFTFL